MDNVLNGVDSISLADPQIKCTNTKPVRISLFFHLNACFVAYNLELSFNYFHQASACE